MPQDLYVLHRLRLSEVGQPVFEALSTSVPGLSRAQARKALIECLQPDRRADIEVIGTK